MRFWQFALGASVVLAVAGCRTNPNTVLVERELRLQEDEIFRLHDCIQDYQMALKSARRRTAALQRQLRDEAPDERRRVDLSGPDYFEPDSPEADDTRQSPRPMPAVPILPKAELGEPTAPEAAATRPSTPGPARQEATDPENMEAAPRWTPPGGQAPDSPLPDSPLPDSPLPGSGPPESQPRPKSGGASHSGADSAQVTRVLINRALTGGIDVDGRPGDEGLLVVVEPRDGRDRYLAAPADIAVVVLDPAQDSHVARWEFTAVETAELFHDSSFGRGIQLEMGWPESSPQSRDLHVFVRYTTADGRRLEVDQPIRVEPPAGALAGWAASPRRARADGRREAPTASAPSRPTPANPASRPRDDGRPSTPRTASRPVRPTWSPERR